MNSSNGANIIVIYFIAIHGETSCIYLITSNVIRAYERQNNVTISSFLTTEEVDQGRKKING